MIGPAHQVALLAGVAEAQTFFQRLDRLVAFFRNFRQKAVDVEADTSLGSVYLAMCKQQAGSSRHRAHCFVVTALAEGIVARYLTSDQKQHAWVEVQAPQSKSDAILCARTGSSTRPVPQWYRIDLEEDLLPEIDVDGGIEVHVPDATGYRERDGPGTAQTPLTGDPMLPHQVENMLDDAERRCREMMSDEINEAEGWEDPGGAGGTGGFSCCEPQWKEGMQLQKSTHLVEGMELWLPERWLTRGLTGTLFDQAQLFAQLLNSMVFATFEGLKRSAVRMFYDEQSSAIAFNLGGALLFNLAFWVTGKHCNKPIEAMYFWFHTLAHEVAHNIVKGHGPEHNYVLQVCWSYAYVCSLHSML